MGVLAPDQVEQHGRMVAKLKRNPLLVFDDSHRRDPRLGKFKAAEVLAGGSVAKRRNRTPVHNAEVTTCGAQFNPLELIARDCNRSYPLSADAIPDHHLAERGECRTPSIGAQGYGEYVRLRRNGR